MQGGQRDLSRQRQAGQRQKGKDSFYYYYVAFRANYRLTRCSDHLSQKNESNVPAFLKAAETLGVAPQFLFKPSDLQKGKNKMKILQTIFMLSYTAEKLQIDVPYLQSSYARLCLSLHARLTLYLWMPTGT